MDTHKHMLIHTVLLLHNGIWLHVTARLVGREVFIVFYVVIEVAI